jgi:hypothetical protein
MSRKLGISCCGYVRVVFEEKKKEEQQMCWFI